MTMVIGDPIRSRRDGAQPTAAAFIASLERIVRPAQQLDIDYAREVERLAPGTGIDPAFVYAQWWHETDAGRVSRWFRDHNPAGIGIPADSTEQPTPIANGVEAARCHLIALAIVLDRAFPSSVPVPLATRGFFDGMLRIAQAPARPDVVTIADLNLPFRDQNGVPQFTWAEDSQYGQKLCNRGNGIFPALGNATAAGPVVIAGQWSAMVATNGATLRDAPDRTGMILERFTHGDIVELLGESARGYLCVASSAQTGWIHSRHLVAKARVSATLRTSGQFKDDGSNVARQIPPGTLVDLDGHCRPGFVEVTRGGLTAWAFSQYLRVNGEPIRTVVAGSTAVATGLAGDPLNLRDQPTTANSTIVGAMNAGDVATLTGRRKPGFTSIAWEGERRWILAEQVTGGDDIEPLPPGSLQADMERAGMCISQDPFDAFSHSRCDCFDFAVPIGTPIHSIAPGRVVFSGQVNDVYKPAKIIVRTDFGDILYAHLSRRDVEQGQIVGAETQIGLSGTENGPHLHIGLEGGKNGDFSVGLTLTEIFGRVGFDLRPFNHC